jgi:hypothetical protein
MVYEATHGLAQRIVSGLPPALAPGDGLPASRHILPCGNQYVGVSPGRLVRLLPGFGRRPVHHYEDL